LTPAAADTAKDDAWNNNEAVWLSAKGPWNNDAFEGGSSSQPPSDPLSCRLDAELPSRPGSRKTVVDRRPR